MRVPIDAGFGEERERFAFRFTCRDCFHYREGGCAHEWPNEQHLEPPAEGADEVIFCKEFELS